MPSGVKQGCVQLPPLFLLVLDMAHEEGKHGEKGSTVEAVEPIWED